MEVKTAWWFLPGERASPEGGELRGTSWVSWIRMTVEVNGLFWKGFFFKKMMTFRIPFMRNSHLFVIPGDSINDPA